MTAPPIEKTTIHSFDGITSVSGAISYPDRYSELIGLLESTQTLIPRGSGLSYSLGSAGSDVLSVSSSHFNRILEYDPLNHTVTVECGLKIGDLLHFLMGKNRWIYPVPGYPDITVGGAIGFNIHGKSQAQSGLFSNWVESFVIWQSGKGFVQVDRALDSELFDLTMGGMGLTGFILSAKIRTVELPGLAVVRKCHPVKNFAEAVEILKNADEKSSIFSWHALSSKRMGRGFIYEDSYVQEPIQSRPFKWKGLVPPPRGSKFFDLVKGLMIWLVPFVYSLQESVLSQRRVLDLFTAQFPFVGKEIYHRFFGRSGVLEYQLLLPQMKTSEFFKDLELLYKKMPVHSTMVSLKRFQGERRFLNFSGNGICFSIDLMNSPKSLEFFAELDQLCIKHGAIPNISKDSRLGLSTVRACYGADYEDFKNQLSQRKLGSAGNFRSYLSERLGL